MSDKDNFIVVLPSNTPSTIPNTPAKYLTTFDEPIYLNDEWKVALLEINFKQSIKNIVKGDSVSVEGIRKITREPLEVILTKQNKYQNITVNLMKAQHPNFRLHKCVEEYDRFAVMRVAPLIKELREETEDDIRLSADVNIRHWYGMIVIKNDSKHYIDVDMPKSLARFFGFGKEDLITPMDDKERFIIKRIAPNSDSRGYNYPYLEHYLKTDLNFKERVIVMGMKPNQDVGVEPDIKITYHPFDRKIEMTSSFPTPGTYRNPKDLASQINNYLEFDKYFKFHYNTLTNRFYIRSIKNKTRGLKLRFRNDLHKALGFEKSEYKHGKKITAWRDFDKMRGISNIFVYSDLVEPSRIGNTIAPFLKIVSFSNIKYGELIYKSYDNPIYLKVTKNFVESMLITICDGQGNIVPFQEGLTTIVLHFKRV